jgi:iron-sulfur cluster assembly accessory protein
METVNPVEKEIFLTESAAEQIQAMIEERELANASLRVFVAGSGCSGLQYGMALDMDNRDDDIEFVYNGVRLVIDPMSMDYMAGSVIDFVEHDHGAGFQIDNPNIQQSTDSASACGGCSGCG